MYASQENKNRVIYKSFFSHTHTHTEFVFGRVSGHVNNLGSKEGLNSRNTLIDDLFSKACFVQVNFVMLQYIFRILIGNKFIGCILAIPLPGPRPSPRPRPGPRRPPVRPGGKGR